MYSILKVKYAGYKPKVVKSVFQKVTTLKEETQREYDFNTIRKGLIEGYQKALDTSFEKENLSEFELNMMEQLVVEKYKTKDWNFKLK